MEFPFNNAPIVDTGYGSSSGPSEIQSNRPAVCTLPGGQKLPHQQNQGNFGGYGRFGAGASHAGANLSMWQQKQDDRQAIDAENVAKAEQIDLTANLHGGWTHDNAKAKLNEFCQQYKIRQPEFRWQRVGPENMYSFYCECSLHVPKLNRMVHAGEHGSNKKVSSTAAALSIVRQLFHLGLLEAFTGKTTVKKSDTTFDPIIGSLTSVVSEELEAYVVSLERDRQDLTNDCSLIAKNEMKFPEQDPVPQGCIPWCPPQPNWDPWRGGNIENGPYVNMPFEFINQDIIQQESDIPNTEIMEKRKELPIFHERGRLLDLIRNNPVVIVKGETGSGKTTQLGQFILEEALENEKPAECSIVVTQPRKISAISIADRISKERNEEIGMSVGYSVRFESVLPRSHGSMLLCTVGVLLRKLEHGLRGVSHVIVDEIHERDLNTDFLLVVLRDIGTVSNSIAFSKNITLAIVLKLSITV